jgi:hypothetical protein
LGSTQRTARRSRCALQSIRIHCSRRRVTAANRPLVELAARSEFRARCSIAPIGFDDPTSPLALASALWFSSSEPRRSQLSVRSSPLFEFRSPLESCPANPSRSAEADGSSHGLSLPSALTGIGGPPAQGFHAPLRSAFRVWLPSWRFTPSEPSPALFHADSAHGIRPSERSPLARYPVRFRPDGPTCRFSRRCTNRPEAVSRPDEPRLLGFDPSESPSQSDAGLARRPPDAPVGFRPF